MNVLIVDDDERFRQIVKQELDRGLVQQLLMRQIARREVHVVGEAGDGEAAVRLARALRPQVVLMDISMPRLDGLEATRRIKAEQPDAKVIILTVHNETAYQRAATECGADGYVTKKALLSDLFSAILKSARPNK